MDLQLHTLAMLASVILTKPETMIGQYFCANMQETLFRLCALKLFKVCTRFCCKYQPLINKRFLFLISMIEVVILKRQRNNLHIISACDNLASKIL